MVTCQPALLAPRQRSAALRRLAATPDEASASPRGRSEERVVSLEELLSAVRGSSDASRSWRVG